MLHSPIMGVNKIIIIIINIIIIIIITVVLKLLDARGPEYGTLSQTM